MKNKLCAPLAGLALFACAAVLCAQTPPQPQPAPEAETKSSSARSSSSANAADPDHVRRFSYGMRVRWWSSQPFRGKGIEVGSDSAGTSTAYNTTSASGRYAAGPVVDFTFKRHWTIRAEAFYEHLQYSKVTKEYTGTPTTGTLNVTLTENTTSPYWDFPLMLRYQGTPKVAPSGQSTSGTTPHFAFIGRMPSHMFVEGGGTMRHLTTVRSGNDTLNADNSTAYNEKPVTPRNRTVEGAVIGVGLRFSDDYNIKVIPEVRYTFWLRPLFESQSTQSKTRQLEIGLSFTF